MELQQLYYFVVTAHTLHFGRAAESIGITQPPLSRSIRNLEKEIGTELFYRANKWKVELTAAGKVFLPEAERLLKQVRNASALAKAAGKGMAGRLTIGAISSMIGHIAFINTLSEMQRKFPEVIVEIVDSNSGALYPQIKKREIDLALMRLDKDFSDSELKIVKLYDDRLSLVMSAHHRLAKKTPLSIAMLKEEPFILVPEKASSVFRNHILDFCRESGGFTPKITREISNSYTAMRLAAAGTGVAMVSSAYDGIFGDQLCFRQFDGRQPSLPMYALYSADNLNPLVSTFLNELTGRIGK